MGVGEYLKKADVFGQSIILTVNRKEKATTVVGGILSLGLISLVISVFFVGMQDVFYKSNPNISTENRSMPNRPSYVVNSTTMPFAFSISPDTNFVIDKPNYFTFYLAQFAGNTSWETMPYINIPFGKCEYADFPINAQDYDDYGIGDLYCPKWQNNTIVGSFGETWVSYISLMVSTCINSTENNNFCAPQKEIEDFIVSEYYYFNIYILDALVNTQVPDAPIQHSFSNIYTLLKTNTKKIMEIDIRGQRVESDDGFIFTANTTWSSLAIDSMWVDDGDSEEDQVLSEFDFYSSNNFIIYHRKYIKIQSVLASVGGLSNLLRVFFTLICYIFSSVERDQAILNKIFEYSIGDTALIRKKVEIKNYQLYDVGKIIPEEKKSPDGSGNSHSGNSAHRRIKKTISTKEDKPVTQFITKRLGAEMQNGNKSYTSTNNLMNISKVLAREDKKTRSPTLPNENENTPPALSNEKSGDSTIIDGTLFKKNAKRMVNLIKRRDGIFQLKFSFIEILKVFVFCEGCKCKDVELKQKQKLYLHSRFVAREFLDITQIIHKLAEIEKLKIILLNTQQIALFDFISKELVSLEEGKNFLGQYRELIADKESLAGIIIDFTEKFRTGKHMSEVDKKLYQLLNEEFKRES